jgi:transcription elongation factor Elf1
MATKTYAVDFECHNCNTRNTKSVTIDIPEKYSVLNEVSEFDLSWNGRTTHTITVSCDNCHQDNAIEVND